MADKIYVIGEDATPVPRGAAPSLGTKAKARARDATAAPADRTPPASPVVLLLAYVAGPFGLLATAQGWRSRVWRVVACVSGVSWLAGVATWRYVPTWMDLHPAMSVVWPLLVLTAATVGSVAWARGVSWAQSEVRTERIPRRLRHPLTGGLFGFVLPGLAHTMTQQPRRAVAVLALTGPFAASVLIAIQTRAIWRGSHGHPNAWISDHTLELTLIACAGMAGAAIFAWLLQALDGMREASLSRRPLGSWVEGLTTLLFIVGVASTLSFERSRTAAEIDSGAMRLRHAGFQIAPLWLWHAASFVDAAEPTYAIRTAELYRELGNDAAAERIRRQLERRWESVRSELGEPADARMAVREDSAGTTWMSPGSGSGLHVY